MKRTLAIFLALAMSFALCACGQAASQPTATPAPAATEAPAAEAAAEPAEIDYPTKEITLLVPFNAGGSSDIVARLFAEHAKKYCDQPIVVVDQGGGVGHQGHVPTLRLGQCLQLSVQKRIIHFHSSGILHAVGGIIAYRREGRQGSLFQRKERNRGNTERIARLNGAVWADGSPAACS